MPNTPTASRLSTGAVLTFACAYLPYAALNTSISVQLPRLFASHLGMGLTVGMVFGLVRLIDIPVDPMLGMLMDRTRTRAGRYRPWMLVGAPIIMTAVYMLYQAPVGVSAAYLLVWLLVLYLGASILLLASNAWASTLAPAYEQRSRIFGAMASMGFFGSASIMLLPILLAQAGGSELDGFRAVGWYIVLLTPLGVAFGVARTAEAPLIGAVPPLRIAQFGQLLSRPNVLRLLAADLLITLGPGWTSALYYYFFKDIRGFSSIAANFLLIFYLAAGLVGAPAIAWLANRTSKHRAFMAATISYSATWMGIYWSPRGNFPVAAAGLFAIGALAAGALVMIRAITADVGDELRLANGGEQIGLLYALTSGTTKLANATSIMLTFAVLGLVGYNVNPGAANTVAQVHSLELAYVAGPICCVVLAGACFLGFDLTRARHAEIRRALEDGTAIR